MHRLCRSTRVFCDLEQGKFSRNQGIIVYLSPHLVATPCPLRNIKMSGKSTFVPSQLAFALEYLIHRPKQLGLDLKSVTLGFVSALTVLGILSSMHVEYSPFNQWISWFIVIGLSLGLITEEGCLQSFSDIPDPQGHSAPSVLDQTNQRLWQMLQTQAIAKQQLKETNQKLLYLAITDGLTQVKNRYFFNQEFQQEWRRSQREGQPISLILLDVDCFKRYNDFYGHQAGDICLQTIAQIAQESLHRSTDFVARYGGEEFAIVLPNTAQEGAVVIAQRIQEALHNLAIPHPESDVSDIVSASFGIASMIPNQDQSCETFIGLADQALYHAKQGGRDRYDIAAL